MNPADWHIRFNEKALIPLDVMLTHSKEWLAALQQVVDRFQAIEHGEERSVPM